MDSGRTRPRGASSPVSPQARDTAPGDPLLNAAAQALAAAVLATPEGQAVAASWATTLATARAVSSGVDAAARTGKLGPGLAAAAVQYARDLAATVNGQSSGKTPGRPKGKPLTGKPRFRV